VHVVFGRSLECFCQRCVGTCPLEYNIEAHLIRMKLNLTYQEFIEKRHVRTAACIPDAHGAIPLQTCIRRTRIIDVKSACCSLRIKDRPRQCCSRTWRLARILAPRSDCGFGSNSRC
jgi:hypothetical protein